MSEEMEVQEVGEAAEQPAEEQSKPKKAKKKAPAKKGKAPAKKGKSESSAPRKVGIVDTVLTVLQKGDGATIAEIHEVLCKRFKDRDPQKMLTTVRHQVRDLAVKHGFEMKKTKVEGRGLVYKAPARIAGFKPVEL